MNNIQASRIIRKPTHADIGAQIEAEKWSKFRGRARVPLEILQFPAHCPKDLDDRTDRLKPFNHVPAIISRVCLENILKVSSISLETLLSSPLEEIPDLRFPENFRLQCLIGKDRIEAAKRSPVFRGNNNWWTVTFYLDDLSNEARKSLIQDYLGSMKYSDGWIYRKIVQFQKKNRFAESHWWSWLTDSKRDILGRVLMHPKLNGALQNLRTIPAILEDLEIAQWHKIIATHSDEEFIRYIDKRILATWKDLLAGDEVLMNLLDPETVRTVQSRCPGIAQEDFEFLEEKLRTGHIFSGVQNEGQKQQIWLKLSKVDYLIPTLGTLQMDFKYLKGPAKVLQLLLRPPANKRRKNRRRFTLREFAALSYSGSRYPGKFLIQTSEQTFVLCSGGYEDQLECGFQQLYLSSMRDAFDLLRDAPLKERGKKTPVITPPDPVKWHRLANFAYIQGFDSPEISRLRAIDPYIEKARQALSDKNLPACDRKTFDALVSATAEMYRSADKDSALDSAPQMLLPGRGEGISRRCGRHGEDSHTYDKNFMFLDVFEKPIEGKSRSISSLFVRRSVFHAFFPRFPDLIQKINLVNPNPKLSYAEIAGEEDDVMSIDITQHMNEASSDLDPNKNNDTQRTSENETTLQTRIRPNAVMDDSPAFSNLPNADFIQRAGKRQRTAYIPPSVEEQEEEGGGVGEGGRGSILSDRMDIDSVPNVPLLLQSPENLADAADDNPQLPQHAPDTSNEHGNNEIVRKPYTTIYVDYANGTREEIQCYNETEVEARIYEYEKKQIYPASKSGRFILPREVHSEVVNGDGYVYLIEEI